MKFTYPIQLMPNRVDDFLPTRALQLRTPLP